MYVYYGIEIPKLWQEWPSAFGNIPRTIKSGNIEVDVPNVGGEPVLLDGKSIKIDDYQLTFQRYPHDIEDNEFKENLGVIGFLICEIDEYTNPTDSMVVFQTWKNKVDIQQQMNNDLQMICKALDFNYLEPITISCPNSCKCC